MVTVEVALKQLPDSGEQIWDLFVELGIKGQTNDCLRCPLARWLSQETGQQVLVDETVACVGDQCFELDEAQQDFVTRFDEGDFLELKEEVDA